MRGIICFPYGFGTSLYVPRSSSFFTSSPQAANQKSRNLCFSICRHDLGSGGSSDLWTLFSSFVWNAVNKVVWKVRRVVGLGVVLGGRRRRFPSTMFSSEMSAEISARRGALFDPGRGWTGADGVGGSTKVGSKLPGMGRGDGTFVGGGLVSTKVVSSHSSCLPGPSSSEVGEGNSRAEVDGSGVAFGVGRKASLREPSGGAITTFS